MRSSGYGGIRVVLNEEIRWREGVRTTVRCISPRLRSFFREMPGRIFLQPGMPHRDKFDPEMADDPGQLRPAMQRAVQLS